MRERRPRLPISSLTLALGVILLSALARAGATGAPPAPLLQGPSSVPTSQPFQVNFYYPKGQIEKWEMDLFHCPTGSTLRPSDDSNTEPFIGQGCEVLPRIGAPISPDTGKETVDMKYGIVSTYKHNHSAATDAQVMKWYQGNWYLRARLISLSGVTGQYGKWHRTLIGSLHIGRRIGTGGLLANRNSSVLAMKGLKPPVINFPLQGAVLRAKVITSGSLPAHARYSDWQCCEMQWQRAVVVTQENDDYVKATTPAGQVPQIPFPTPRAAWSGLGLYNGSHPPEHGPSFASGWRHGDLRSHSRKFGYQYWIRIREHYIPGNAFGPWSAWRSFIVQEPHTSTLVNFGAVHAMPGVHAGGQTSTSGQRQGAGSAPPTTIRRLNFPAQSIRRQ